MALRALMIRKKIDDKKKALEDLRSSADFEKREKELEQSIEEAATDEERSVVESEIEKFETEKRENEQALSALEKEIGDLETELRDLETKNEGTPDPKGEEGKEDEERGQVRIMETRKFYGMNLVERNAFFQREDVKAFIAEVRTCIKEKRALTNVGLTIPEVMLDLMKQVVQETSKLYNRVAVRRVGGTARQVIMGEIPEAVWTEMCATLNELTLGFNDVEVDGYKVGGYFAVCNAILEDNDVNLTSEIINALGKAIGKALDKAILYGTGTKMPLGIVTRLAAATAPAGYPSTARAYVDLTGTNVITGTGATGLALFKEIATNAGVITNDYFDGEITWIMNKKTHMKLIVQSMDKNLNAAIVAGINNSMPVIGGDIVELPFIPDDNIVFGYMPAYLLAERAGTKLSQSEHAKFIDDQTVFKGTARYDGTPVIAEAFGVMSLTSTAPTTTVTFPTDSANA